MNVKYKQGRKLIVNGFHFESKDRKIFEVFFRLLIKIFLVDILKLIFFDSIDPNILWNNYCAKCIYHLELVPRLISVICLADSINIPEIYRCFETCSFANLLRQTAPTLMPIDHHFLFTTSRFLCRAQTSKSSRYIDPVDRKTGEIVERGITQEQFPPGDNQAELHFSIRPSYGPFIRSFVYVLGGEGG